MNKVVHFEIPAEDLDRANEFYKRIFGWQIKDVSMNGMTYFIATTVSTDSKNMPMEAGAINGGLMKRSKDVRSPVFAIDVDSIDEYTKKIKSAGGEVVMPKMQVGDMGYYAYVKDTEGNVFGIWETIR